MPLIRQREADTAEDSRRAKKHVGADRQSGRGPCGGAPRLVRPQGPLRVLPGGGAGAQPEGQEDGRVGR